MERILPERLLCSTHLGSSEDSKGRWVRAKNKGGAPGHEKSVDKDR